jgi:hypothetical protein
MSCPTNPPAPSGYRVWRKPVPTALTQWAMHLRDHINQYPYGTTWTTSYNGQGALARKDYHVYTYRKQSDGTMQLETGICISGITLYEPIPATSSPTTGTGATPDPVTPTTTLGDSDLTTPDPNAAVYSKYEPPETTDWPLTLLSAGAILGVSVAFAFALKHAGRAAKGSRS